VVLRLRVRCRSSNGVAFVGIRHDNIPVAAGAVGSAALIGTIPIGTLYQWITRSAESSFPAAAKIDVPEPFWQLLLEMSIGGAIIGSVCGVLWWIVAKPMRTTSGLDIGGR
jgi:hypothetical protein